MKTNTQTCTYGHVVSAEKYLTVGIVQVLNRNQRTKAAKGKQSERMAQLRFEQPHLFMKVLSSHGDANTVFL